MEMCIVVGFGEAWRGTVSSTMNASTYTSTLLHVLDIGRKKVDNMALTTLTKWHYADKKPLPKLTRTNLKFNFS